jgi:hypothetical protein
MLPSFPRWRESRAPRPNVSSWTPAQAGVTIIHRKHEIGATQALIEPPLGIAGIIIPDAPLKPAHRFSPHKAEWGFWCGASISGCDDLGDGVRLVQPLGPPSLGSRRLCSPSPKRLHDITVRKIIMPRQMASSGALAINSWALVSMLPQLVIGG